MGIGFQVDKNSLDDTEKSMDKAKEKVEEFNNNSKKGFSETGNSLKDLFSLVSASGSTLGALFPELRAPFKDLMKNIATVKKAYNEVTKSKAKENIDKETTIKETTNIVKDKKIKKDIPKEHEEKASKINKTIHETTTVIRDTKEKSKIDFKNIAPKKPITIKDFIKGNEKLDLFKDLKGIDASGKLGKELLNLKGLSKGLAVEGGAAVKAFAATSVGALALVVAAVAGVAIGIKKVINNISDLAKQDIGYEKLARQLWTTKENARDVDSALKSLGASMEDIKLSPTLLKQFNQLRKDAAQLRMPSDFKDNIKVVQGIGLEFKRFKQSIKMFFQLINGYILKYCAGPLASIKKSMKGFNDKVIKAIPVIAKFIGSTIGVLLRLLLTWIKLMAIPFKIALKAGELIGRLINKIPEPLKKILKLVMTIGAFIIAGPIGAVLLLIAAIDDLFTFIQGGKSVTGDVVEGIKKKGLSAIKSIGSKWGDLKSKFKKGMSSLKDDWNSYLDKALKVLDAIKDKAKTVWKNIKEWSKGFWEKTKDFVANIPAKVNVYNKDYSMAKVPASYLTNKVSNQSTTANSNNKISNANTINVYGTDAKSTATAVKSKISGITMRSLQGVT